MAESKSAQGIEAAAAVATPPASAKQEAPDVQDDHEPDDLEKSLAGIMDEDRSANSLGMCPMHTACHPETPFNGSGPKHDAEGSRNQFDQI